MFNMCVYLSLCLCTVVLRVEVNSNKQTRVSADKLSDEKTVIQNSSRLSFVTSSTLFSFFFLSFLAFHADG